MKLERVIKRTETIEGSWMHTTPGVEDDSYTLRVGDYVARINTTSVYRHLTIIVGSTNLLEVFVYDKKSKEYTISSLQQTSEIIIRKHHDRLNSE